MKQPYATFYILHMSFPRKGCMYIQPFIHFTKFLCSTPLNLWILGYLFCLKDVNLIIWRLIFKRFILSSAKCFLSLFCNFRLFSFCFCFKHLLESYLIKKCIPVVCLSTHAGTQMFLRTCNSFYIFCFMCLF